MRWRKERKNTRKGQGEEDKAYEMEKRKEEYEERTRRSRQSL